jgi:hypothetical protein
MEKHRAVSSAVEHTLHTRGVIGSIPIPPTIPLISLETLAYSAIVTSKVRLAISPLASLAETEKWSSPSCPARAV